MKKYKKFEKLHEYFLKQNKKKLSLTFEDIENINGHKLSPSASNYKEYWYGPNSHSLPRAWSYNGYKLKSVSLEEKKAIFEKLDSWIISANHNIYNHQEAFNDLDFIDWRQENYTYQVGDTIYIYSTLPFQTISHRAVVVKTKLTSSEILDDSKYWKDAEEYKTSLNGHYVRLKLMETYSNDFLHLDYLIEKGLKAAPQGPQRINERLLNYIKTVSLDNEDIVYPDSEGIGELYEGGIKTVKVNVYERNPSARKECLEYHKYNCKVCNMNFEERYGELGKDFIHVHHIVPISTINKRYKVDPIRDLIPVCPNCHAMLHKKDSEGNLLSIEDLKGKIS